jgi:PAS domain S-box-containing protein
VEVSPLPHCQIPFSRAQAERIVAIPRPLPVDRPHRFHDLLSQLGAIVWEADPLTLATVFVSRQAEEILGYPLQEWRDDESFLARNLFPDDREQTLARLFQIAFEGGDHILEFRLVTADGRTVWLRVLVHSVCDWQGRPRSLHGVMIDVSSQHLDSRSHRVHPSTPGIPSGRAPGLSSSGRGDIPFSLRLEGPVREADRRPIVDLNQTIRSLGAPLESLLGERIRLQLDLSAEPAALRIERQQLERAILNLALHAREAMLEGGQLMIATSLLPATGEDGRRLVLNVMDTGIGLDAVLRARAFQSLFERGSSEPSAIVSLASVEEIVSDAEGSIEIHDEPGLGTCFEIVFPLVEAEEGRPARGRAHLSLAD